MIKFYTYLESCHLCLIPSFLLLLYRYNTSLEAASVIQQKPALVPLSKLPQMFDELKNVPWFSGGHISRHIKTSERRLLLEIEQTVHFIGKYIKQTRNVNFLSKCHLHYQRPLQFIIGLTDTSLSYPYLNMNIQNIKDINIIDFLSSPCM